jgi:hypothetical protein
MHGHMNVENHNFSYNYTCLVGLITFMTQQIAENIEIRMWRHR